MAKLEAQHLLKRADKMFNSSERVNVEHSWSELSEFVLNNQSGVFHGRSTPGTKRTQRLFDSTAGQANHDLSSAIHATLTNPSTQWSKLRFKSEKLNNNQESVAWIEAANNIMHDFFNESNFDTMAGKNYQMFSSLGSMVLLQEEATRELVGEFVGFRFSAWHLSEVAFSENSTGIVDVIYRKFEFSARQALEKWGADNIPDEVLADLEKDPEKKSEYVHCIYPRDKKDVKLNDAGLASPELRPFASVYVAKKGSKIVDEGGYYELPVYITRWSTMPGEEYGRGPGHIALPDIRTLNKTKELNLHSLAKAVNPPLIASSRGILGTLDLRPGKLSVVNGDPSRDIREMVPQARFDVTQFSVEDLRNSIKQVFLIDKFQLPPRTETGEMTATEVLQRAEEMQRVIGPTLSRLNNEFLTPLILRSFKMLLRAEALPQVPQAVLDEGIDIDIVFVNQLARSQQIQDVSNIQGWVQELSFLAQVKPEVLDYINADGIAKHTAKVRGIPEAAVANDDAVEELRAQRAQQQQQQQALESGVQAADIASKVGGLGGQ